MSRDIILTNKPWVVKWVSDKVIGEGAFPLESPNYGLMRDGRLVAGVVYTNISKTNVYMHVASDNSRRWLTRAFLKLCFWFPFCCLKCNRVTGLVRPDNAAALRFDEHLGFKREGVVRKGEPDGSDLVLLGLLKEDCRFIPQDK